MLINEIEVRQIIRRALLKEAEEKGLPKSKERMLKFANFIAEKLKLKQIGATDKDRERWKELISAIENKDYKLANTLFSKAGYGEIWNNWDDPIIRTKISRLKRGIRIKASSPTPGKGKGAVKKKKASSNKLIEKIQKLLNIATDAGTIDGDYQNKKLNEDGEWGSRTRSATSKALSLFTQADLRKKYGFKGITDDGLALEKRGGPGKWVSKLLLLTKGVTPEGAGSEDFEKGTSKKPYGKLIYVLTKLNEYQKGKGKDPKPQPKPEDPKKPKPPTPDPGKGEKKQDLEEARSDGKKMVAKITALGKKNSQKALDIGEGPYTVYVLDKNAALKFPWKGKSAGEYLPTGRNKYAFPTYWMRKVADPRERSRNTAPLIDMRGEGFGTVDSSQLYKCFYVAPYSWGNMKTQSGIFNDPKKPQSGFNKIGSVKNYFKPGNKIPDSYDIRQKGLVWAVSNKSKRIYIFDLN